MNSEESEFKLKLFGFVDALSEYLKCDGCGKLVTDPYSTPCCHIFCYTCYFNRKHSSRCLKCNFEVWAKDVIPCGLSESIKSTYKQIINSIESMKLSDNTQANIISQQNTYIPIIIPDSTPIEKITPRKIQSSTPLILTDPTITRSEPFPLIEPRLSLNQNSRPSGLSNDTSGRLSFAPPEPQIENRDPGTPNNCSNHAVLPRIATEVSLLATPRRIVSPPTYHPPSAAINHVTNKDTQSVLGVRRVETKPVDHLIPRRRLRDSNTILERMVNDALAQPHFSNYQTHLVLPFANENMANKIDSEMGVELQNEHMQENVNSFGQEKNCNDDEKLNSSDRIAVIDETMPELVQSAAIQRNKLHLTATLSSNGNDNSPIYQVTTRQRIRAIDEDEHRSNSSPKTPVNEKHNSDSLTVLKFSSPPRQRRLETTKLRVNTPMKQLIVFDENSDVSISVDDRCVKLNDQAGETPIVEGSENFVINNNNQLQVKSQHQRGDANPWDAFPSTMESGCASPLFQGSLRNSPANDRVRTFAQEKAMFGRNLMHALQAEVTSQLDSELIIPNGQVTQCEDEAGELHRDFDEDDTFEDVTPSMQLATLDYNAHVVGVAVNSQVTHSNNRDHHLKKKPQVLNLRPKNANCGGDVAQKLDYLPNHSFIQFSAAPLADMHDDESDKNNFVDLVDNSNNILKPVKRSLQDRSQDNHSKIPIGNSSEEDIDEERLSFNNQHIECNSEDKGAKRVNCVTRDIQTCINDGNINVTQFEVKPEILSLPSANSFVDKLPTDSQTQNRLQSPLHEKYHAESDNHKINRPNIEFTAHFEEESNILTAETKTGGNVSQIPHNSSSNNNNNINNSQSGQEEHARFYLSACSPKIFRKCSQVVELLDGVVVKDVREADLVLIPTYHAVLADNNSQMETPSSSQVKLMPRRKTIALLHALAYNKPVLSIDWIFDSLIIGKFNLSISSLKRHSIDFTGFKFLTNSAEEQESDPNFSFNLAMMQKIQNSTFLPRFFSFNPGFVKLESEVDNSIEASKDDSALDRDTAVSVAKVLRLMGAPMRMSNVPLPGGLWINKNSLGVLIDMALGIFRRVDEYIEVKKEK